MDKDSKTRIFRAKTFTEAVNKAKLELGRDIRVVSRRDVREDGGLFSKILKGGKMDSLEVELEVAVDHGEAETAKGPAAKNPLLKSYAKALEGAEKHSVANRQLMAEAQRANTELGATGEGIAGSLKNFQSLIEESNRENRRLLEQSNRENMELRRELRDILSLQARGGLPAVGTELMDLYRRLVDRDVGEALARDMVEKVQADNPGLADAEALLKLLRKEAARRIPTAGPLLPKEKGPTVVAFVGPTGMGKSTALLKLAIDFTLRRGRSVALVNEDMHRPGAEQQMNNLSTLMRVPMVSASRPKEIADAVRSMSGRDVVFIDTAGRSPRDAAGIAALGELLAAAGADEIHLTLSAGSSVRLMREAVAGYRAAGFDRLVVTKLDECTTFGGIFDVVSGMAEGLSYVTDGQDYMLPILPADGDWLAGLVLGLVEIKANGGGGDDTGDAA